MRKIKLFVFTTFLAALVSGCVDRYDYKGCHKPVYLSYEDLRANYPALKEPREIEKAGKIYVYGDTLLVNEKNRGIHVIDNRVKESPIRKRFIEIPGNIDLAMKDGYLYVDSFVDLAVIDLRNINNITVLKSARKNDVFPYDHYQALSEEDLEKERCYGYDEDRGVIIGYK